MPRPLPSAGRRWVKRYRDAAWEVALEEARRSAFFARLFYFVSDMVGLMSRD